MRAPLLLMVIFDKPSASTVSASYLSLMNYKLIFPRSFQMLELPTTQRRPAQAPTTENTQLVFDKFEVENRTL
jgi:hypothetical protein